MMAMHTETRETLANMIRLGAGNQLLDDSWIYLPVGPLHPSTNVLLLNGEEEEPDEVASSLGYPVEGLQLSDVKEIVEGATRLAPDPSDEQLVEAFIYYLKFDAFLPAFGTPTPPPHNEILSRLDKEFIENLGPERTDTPCRKDGCAHGAIALSVLCAQHHFEAVRGRPYPY